MKDVRLLPIVLFALGSMFALKVNALLDHAGLELSGSTPAYAEADREAAPLRPVPAAPPLIRDITGSSAPAPEPAAKPPAEELKPVEPPQVKPVRTADPLQAEAGASPAAGVLLDRLQERREQLDQQARDLETRENLLRAAEKRIQDKIQELKQLQAGSDAIEQKEAEASTAKVKTLVVMYETMKPKDAARIFDRLDMPILVDVASAMKPAKLADVLAAMDSDVAKRLTVELANKLAPRRTAAAAPDQPALDLPKIEGRPATP